MFEITKKNALELDELFTLFLNLPHDKKTLAWINIERVYREAYLLKDKDVDYVKQLLLKVRMLQRKNEIPELFSGDGLIAITNGAVRDFLKAGGFEKLQQKLLLKTIGKIFMALLAITGVVLAALALK